MITPRINCSRVSVRRVSRVCTTMPSQISLEKLQGCAWHSEATTAFLMKKERAR